MEHCSGGMSYSKFKDFCTSCWRKGRFKFIVINKDCERDNDRYRYGFDTFVIIYTNVFLKIHLIHDHGR